MSSWGVIDLKKDIVSARIDGMPLEDICDVTGLSEEDI